MAPDLESAMKQRCIVRGFFVVISVKNDYRYPCYLESDKKFSLSLYAIKKKYLDIRNISFLFTLLVFSSSTSYNTIQYNSLLTLPWWGFSVTMRLLIKIREVVNNSIKKERVR